MSDVDKRNLAGGGSLGDGRPDNSSQEKPSGGDFDNQGSSNNSSLSGGTGSNEDTRTASGTTRSLGNTALANSDGESSTTVHASATVSISDKAKTISENATPLSSLESEGAHGSFPWPVILLLGCVGTLLIGIGGGYLIANRNKSQGSQTFK